jgi:dephospho-CoA kinase
MVIGVFGIIGSGKSLVSEIFKEKYDFKIINADNIAHTVIDYDQVKEEIINITGVTLKDKIDRRQISSIFFMNPDKLKKLEKIMWPYMKDIIIKEIDSNDKVIIDAAVLYKAKWDDLCDYTIYVDTNRENIFKRLEDKKYKEDLLDYIIKMQEEIVKQKKYASFVIENNNMIEDLNIKISEVWKKICH